MADSTKDAPESEGKQPLPFACRYSSTIDDATEATGLSRSRLYELIRDKKVQTARNGRRPLVIVSSLLAAIQ